MKQDQEQDKSSRSTETLTPSSYRGGSTPGGDRWGADLLTVMTAGAGSDGLGLGSATVHVRRQTPQVHPHPTLYQLGIYWLDGAVDECSVKNYQVAEVKATT